MIAKCMLGLALCVFCVFMPAHSKEFVFKWGMTEDAYTISTHLKERVVFSFLQENVRYKVEKLFGELGISYEVFVEAKLLPCHFSVFFGGQDDYKIQEVERLLSRDPSYFLDEFETVQEIWIEWVQKEKSLYGDFNYVTFLAKVENAIQRVSQQDLLFAFQKNRGKEDDSSHFFIQSSLEVYETPSDNPELGTFFSLSLTEEDKEMIREFVLCLSSKSLFQMILDRESLERTKDRLKMVHPFRFIVFILSDDSLRQTLEVMHKTEFKWSFLIMGLERALKRKKESKALNEYISGFAALLSVDEKIIRSYVDRDDYNGMFNYLIDVCSF